MVLPLCEPSLKWAIQPKNPWRLGVQLPPQQDMVYRSPFKLRGATIGDGHYKEAQRWKLFLFKSQIYHLYLLTLDGVTAIPQEEFKEVRKFSKPKGKELEDKDDEDGSTGKRANKGGGKEVAKPIGAFGEGPSLMLVKNFGVSIMPSLYTGLVGGARIDSKVFHFCCKSMPVFKNLLNLSIERNKEKGWQVMSLLLKRCPNLHTLVVIKNLVHRVTNRCRDACACIPEKPRQEKEEEEEVCCLWTCQVKVLEISEYGGSFQELSVISWAFLGQAGMS